MLKYFFTAFIYISVLLSSYNDFNTPFINVAKNQTKTIVSIVSEKTQTMQSPFNFYFSPFEGFDFHDPYEQQYQSQSLGSGVLFDSYSGYIITNNHVIEGADNIKVILNDKREFEAEIIGTDPLSDIAVIKINANNLDEVVFGNSDNMQIGEWVIAIGSPFGLHLNHTVTAGIVSGVGRTDIISRANYENFIQHDAAINPGNSGGGLFNLSGELIGINTAIATDGYSRSNAGVGFAVPINQVKYIVEDLISDGKVSRGWLGVQIRDIDDDIIKAMNLNFSNGVLIQKVTSDSPAERGGLKEKDIIIALNNKLIKDANHLRNEVAIQEPNKIVLLTIYRDYKEVELQIELGYRPEDLSISENIIEDKFDILGLKVKSNSDGNGVIITDVDKNSNAFKKNLQQGEIIVEIGNEAILNISEYKKIISEYSTGDAIMLKIIGESYTRYEAFKIK